MHEPVGESGPKGDEQTNTLQTKGLRAASCRRLFEEAASGGRWDRPELHRLLDQLREGDTVVVWKLDRLSRSLKDVVHIMERIAKAGAGFRSITENIDTTTPAGRMMMQLVGAFAEFERAMIRERTSAGLAAARAEGRVGGRRKKLDPGKRKEIAESVISGRRTPCPPKHVDRWLQVRLACFRLSPSCLKRLLHTFLSLRPARHYPRFWIRRSSSEHRRDFNSPDSCAAQRTLRGSPPLAGASVFRPRGFGRLCLFPWHRRPGSQVPCESPNESHASCTPDTAWPVSRFSPYSSRSRV
jgi:Resolvase, N terminal domain